MTNIIEFSSTDKIFAFCIVDDIHSYKSEWTKEIIKNISDFTISNLTVKGYNVFLGYNEDQLLKYVSADYKYAVVISPGTEFINGFDFFNELKNLTKTDFFIAGHILDRGDAYYELHHQCYIINLSYYKELDFPIIGKESLGELHTQICPIRSEENIHDGYTPIWISSGADKKIYNHKCHGWNILKIGFEKKLNICVFNQKIRQSKKHHYPESQKDFNNNLRWIYYRYQHCFNEYVHLQNTERSSGITGNFDQIVLPASGTLYLNFISKGTIIYYDYNQKSLDYWENNIIKNKNITYKFVKTDLLIDDNLIQCLESNSQKTLINLSNIFCYEGTAALFPLYHRLQKENELIKKLKIKLDKSCILNFSKRAATGFLDLKTVGDLQDFYPVEIADLKKPTWHYTSDWNQ